MTAEDPDALAEQLVEETVAVVLELHEAIEHLRRPGRFPPDGAPAAAVFDNPHGATGPRHRSGRPSQAVALLATEAADQARERLSYGRHDGNPLLLALALAAFYVVEGRRTDALGLRRAVSGRIVAGVVEPGLVNHEPAVTRGGTVLRTWFPVRGAPLACVQLRFPPPEKP